MPALGLNHYNIRAPSPLLETLRDFYCLTLGLQVGPRPQFRTAGYWLYAGDAAVLHLSRTREGELRQVGVIPTFDHVAFTCTDAAAMQAILQAADIAFSIDDSPQRAQRQIFFRDPAGNGVELNFDLRVIA